MTEDQQLELWLGATRYYLGRMTASVSSFCDTLIQEWDHLPQGCRQLIQRDIEEAFHRDDWQRTQHGHIGRMLYALGHDCDRAAWTRVRGLWHASPPLCV